MLHPGSLRGAAQRRNLDRGHVVALDAPARLAAQVKGTKQVRFVPSAPFEDRVLTALPEVDSVTRSGSHIIVTGQGQLVNAVILTLAGAGVTALDVELGSSTLEDAFMKLTARDGVLR